MTQSIRIIVKTEYGCKNFLKIQETKKGDIIVSPRGKRHSVELEDCSLDIAPESEATITNVTIHPNLMSEIGSISVNYKDENDGIIAKSVSGLLGVKENILMYPVLASVGRNLSTENLSFNNSDPQKREKMFELWDDNGFELKADSLAYLLAVCNKDIKIKFPEYFPRNIKFFKFKYLKLIFFYWLYNQPTKFRGTSLRFETNGKYIPGFQPHELLNLTNDLTLQHLRIYKQLPDIPVG